MTAPFVGFMVDKTWFHFGWPDYLFSFFSTVTGRLEKHWGERFPCIMNDLCEFGCIKKEKAEQAREELRVIRRELKAFGPRELIWDVEHPEKEGPWGRNNEGIRMDDQIKDLSCCFYSEDRVNLFDLLDIALGFAQERNADLELQKYPQKQS